MIQNLPSPKTKQKGKAVGRGIGSGKGGHTSGRGNKGQRSRSGFAKTYRAFEGGQLPISRRLPKYKGESKKSPSREFFLRNIFSITLPLSVIEKNFKDGETVSEETVVAKSLINPKKGKTIKLKILFDKVIDKKLVLKGVAASKSAQEAIKKAGGSVE